MPTTVTAAFTQLRGRLALTSNQRRIAAGRLANLQSILAPPDYAIAKAPWAIGSYGRDTIVRPERDIDIMVILDYPTYRQRYDNDPQGMLRWLRDRLNAKYPNTRVGRSEMAIHLALGEDLEVDLVPGFRRNGGGYFISNGSGGWLATNPPVHDKLMSDADSRLGGRLKPLVRVMKAWNIMGNGGRLSSFHLEMMVAKMWEDATSLPALPTAVTKTLKAGGSWVRATRPAPWTESGTDLDAYLSATTRTAVAKIMDEDAVRAQAALDYVADGNQRAAYGRWAIVFNHQFPAYG